MFHKKKTGHAFNSTENKVLFFMTLTRQRAKTVQPTLQAPGGKRAQFYFYSILCLTSTTLLKTFLQDIVPTTAKTCCSVRILQPETLSTRAMSRILTEWIIKSVRWYSSFKKVKDGSFHTYINFLVWTEEISAWFAVTQYTSAAP